MRLSCTRMMPSVLFFWSHSDTTKGFHHWNLNWKIEPNNQFKKQQGSKENQSLFPASGERFWHHRLFGSGVDVHFSFLFTISEFLHLYAEQVSFYFILDVAFGDRLYCLAVPFLSSLSFLCCPSRRALTFLIAHRPAGVYRHSLHIIRLLFLSSTRPCQQKPNENGCIGTTRTKDCPSVYWCAWL